MNRIERTNLQTALIPLAQHTVTVNGTGIDVAELQDMVKLILSVESISGAGRLLDVEIEDGDTLGGSYASLSPPVTFAQVGVSDAQEAINLKVDGTRAFIRAAITIAGSSPIFQVGLTMLGRTGQE